MTVFKKENSHENTHRKCRIFSQVYETVVRVKGTKMASEMLGIARTGRC